MKKSAIITLIVIVAIGAIYALSRFSSTKVVIPEQPATPTIPETPTPPANPTGNEQQTEPEPTPEASYTTITLSTDHPGKELTDAIGQSHVAAVLALNRIDDKHLWKGLTLTIPTDFIDWDYSFMPAHIAAAESIPKLVLISQRVQSFGFYENGKLILSGPVSTGKQSTLTPSRLYFTNWKGKEVVSTFSDEWILKWNFNIDNFEGIGLHHYALPGYPASHSCVRFYESDAEFLYNWADQWVLANDGQTKLASGTPVIIFGAYNFSKSAPWKQLPNNAKATTLSQDELETLVESNLTAIQKESTLRAQVLGQS